MSSPNINYSGCSFSWVEINTLHEQEQKLQRPSNQGCPKCGAGAISGPWTDRHFISNQDKIIADVIYTPQSFTKRL